MEETRLSSVGCHHLVNSKAPTLSVIIQAEEKTCGVQKGARVMGFCFVLIFVILVLFRSFKKLPPKVNSQLANIMIKKTLVYPHFCDF